MKRSQKLKKPDSSSKLILHEIIGLTIRNANGLASGICSSKCVYLAGCVVVVYDVDLCTQSHLVVSHRMPKPLSCVAVSQNGRFVAAGESQNLSAVLLWDCDTLGFMSELKGHLYGAECLAFSPNGEYLVTVGGYIYLWDWRRSILLAKVKASSNCPAITSVTFSPNGKFLVTAGSKHLKFWTVGSLQRTRSNKGVGSPTIHEKPADHGLHKGNSFVSVISTIRVNSCSRNVEQAGEGFLIYALTDAGTLCLMNYGLSIKKSVDLKVEKGFALSASERLVACACSKGVVQLFTLETLEYASTIRYSGAKTCHNHVENHAHLAEAKNTEFQPSSSPDAVACQFSTTVKLVVIYGDHSLYVWDVHDENKPTRCSMMISHSACIWDIKNLSCGNMHNPTFACVARGCSGGISFATCSADGTIRLWDLAFQLDPFEVTTDSNSQDAETGGTMHLASAGIFERDLVETGDSTFGLRSLAVSEDGRYLAAGDTGGNLHIYDLQESEYTCFTDAHDAEILSLGFSFLGPKDVDSEKALNSHYLLASGGKDRAIHIYDVKRNFDLIQSIREHSAAVTSVKLPCNGRKILTCSADRSLVFNIVRTASSLGVSHSGPEILSRGAIYDMAIDSTSGHVVAVGKDKKIDIFEVETGKLLRSFKQDRDYGDPIKVTVDPSCSYLVCSFSNRIICVFDFITGELVAQATGHSEVVNGVIFLPDCKHIVSVGGDGCIFVWKVPSRMATQMAQTLKENAGALSPKTLAQTASLRQIIVSLEEDNPKGTNLKPIEDTADFQRESSPWTSSFKFSVSRLPKWAQAKVTASGVVTKTQQSQKQEGKTPLNLVDDAEDHSAIVNLENQTPENGSRSEVSCLSSLSKDFSDARTSMLQEDAVSRNMENNRWNTVYNVCLDLLDSPNIQPSVICGAAQDLPKLQNNHEIFFGEKFYNKNSPENAGTVCVDCSPEHSDVFRRFFSCLPTIDEVKANKSSQRRRYSSQFFLRRDYFGESKQPLRTPSRNLIPHAPLKDHQKHAKQEENSSEVLEENTSELESNKSTSENNEPRARSTEGISNREHDAAVPERITSCRQALHSLNVAAQNFFQLLSDLSTAGSQEHISSELRAQLYNETVELLPGISHNIDAVANITRKNQHHLLSTD